MPKPSVRLPSYIKPERYQIMLKPDLNAFTFEGEETIFLDIQKPVKEITLHAKEVKVGRAVLKNGKFQISNFKIQGDAKTETVKFTSKSIIPKGHWELELKFHGILNDQMRGFYRSKYFHEGKEKYMATSQFEATDARRAFPCVDEPAAKAVFDVTLMIPKAFTAISNTIESEIAEHENGYKLVKFLPTPKMSTYLLAFIVGDFEYIEAKTKRGVLTRVFVTPGKKHQAKFALECSVKILDFYEQYFGINYPLPVMDLIAIPDFSHGAMENWGAVTYRESALLVDPEHSSAANKQWVALVIAHELAHQWFGNLVTMEWWTHLWLNEGFASYIEYLAVDRLFPEWDIWTQFAHNDLNIALELDSLKNTHPIEVEVHHPDEIGEIFDEVSYSKGASIIRMLAGYLGAKDFRDGLRHYLKKHAYSNASTAHLWEAFEKISKKPVGKIMNNWTACPGYPLIRIIEKPDRLTISQSRFFSSPISQKEVSDKTLWQIPLNLMTPKQVSPGQRRQFLLNTKTLTIKKPQSPWIKFNQGETGFYRVDYPAQMLAALKKPIKEKQFSAIDRLAIARDVFSLSQAGHLPTAEALAALEFFTNETDYTVWVQLCSGLADLRALLFGQPYYSEFVSYCRGIIAKMGAQVGWQPKGKESHTQSLLRSLILSQQIAYEDKNTIARGNEIFKKSLIEKNNKPGKNIPPDIRGAVYYAVAKAGGAKEHGLFVDFYKTEDLSEEKNRLGRALGQFSKINLLKSSLDFALSPNVRIQDSPGIFASVWANPLGRPIAWQYTKKHWKVLLARYPASGHMLNRFIKSASHFVSSKEAADLSAFFKKHRAPGAERTIAQVLEKIYANHAWVRRDSQHVGIWLKSRRR